MSQKHLWTCGKCTATLNIDKGMNEVFAHVCTTPQRDWREEFDKRFPEFGYPRGTRNDRMKVFIESLLTAQTEKHHMVLETMKKISANVLIRNEGPIEHALREGYNSALTEAQERLRQEK